MKRPLSPYAVLLLLVVATSAIFGLRTLLAATGDPPRLADLFTAIVLAGSLVVLFRSHHALQRLDWAIGIGLGGVVGLTMLPATLFTPYPFFGVINDNLGQAVVRGVGTALAALGGLAILRRGGPVAISAANGQWGKSGRSIVLGLAVGAPLALLNLFALQLTGGQSIRWQNPLAALLDALQPALVEEVVYRFALWGLLWLILRGSLAGRAAWAAGGLALLIHNFAHFDDLFVQNPLLALGMGLVMALLWGLPPTLLALRRDLESAVAFHWIQDAARFLAGF